MSSTEQAFKPVREIVAGLSAQIEATPKGQGVDLTPLTDALDSAENDINAQMARAQSATPDGKDQWGYPLGWNTPDAIPGAVPPAPGMMPGNPPPESATSPGLTAGRAPGVASTGEPDTTQGSDNPMTDQGAADNPAKAPAAPDQQGDGAKETK